MLYLEVSFRQAAELHTTLSSQTKPFTVLYAVGMDLIELETVSGLLLLVFVIPLAITMTIFLLWIMYGLTGTIAELAARRQRYKLGMFKTLYRLLLVAVLALFGFFVVSSMSFSSRYDEGA